MSIGDFLYQLTARDRQVTGLEAVFFDFGLGSVAATNVACPFTYTVPRGRALKVNSASLVMLPGATADNSNAYIIASDSSGQSYQIYAKTFYQTTGRQARSADFSPELVIPAGVVLSAVGVFSNATAANQIQAGFSGLLLPRGSIAI